MDTSQPDQAASGASAHHMEMRKSAAKTYAKFAIVMVTSFLLMYLLTFAQIRTLDHFYLNLANLYMAIVMTAVMGVVMLLVMSSMISDTKIRIALLVAFAALGVAAFAMGRTEAFVGNQAFLKSMIPHHSRAILVCQEADISNPQIVSLCREIVSSQQREIGEMKQMLQQK